MLDSNFNVKLGDFGLARLVDRELCPKTTSLAGTFRYMGREYVTTSRVGKESYVYNFRVVVSKIGCGSKTSAMQIDGEFETGLVEWIWNCKKSR